MNSIAGPTLQRFKLHHTCAACGQNMTPFHRLRQLLFGSTDSHMNQVLCHGGKEPTEEGAVATIMGNVPVQRNWNCAGIGEPHLHIGCRNCNFQFLTDTRKALG